MGDTASTAASTTRAVVSVSAGASHTVALLSDGQVCSWGRGEDGQLGHGDADEKPTPTIVGSLESAHITAITCGADHTTAYSSSKKTLYSWGWLDPQPVLLPITGGDFGRLGHGNSSDLFIPHPIKALSGLVIKQIACGDCHCLAITGDGEVHSWGRNQNGQLGLGDTEDGLAPRKVQAFEGMKVAMLSAGAEHTAAVTEDGKVFGWGWGRYGNLGLGDLNDRHLPEQVAALHCEHATMVACGWRHTIVVAASGALYTFGWSKYGQLGHGDNVDQLLPKRVQALHNHTIKQIAGGWRHTVALTSEGKLYAWGWNKCGQVGVGNTEDRNTPQLVEGLANTAVVQVSCGWRHTAAITVGMDLFTWGRGTSGQLGHGDSSNWTVPKRVDALSASANACLDLPRSSCLPSPTSTWISPSERYAVVPDDESIRPALSGASGGRSLSSDVKRQKVT